MSCGPKPIDTSEVALPDGARRLTERLAEHGHDLRARRRLAEGWRFGPSRRDDRDEYPCPAPYDRPSEVEKPYDRSAALEALEAILAPGDRIESPTSDRIPLEDAGP